MSSDGIVVVGGGIAGQSTCEALRRRDRKMPLTLVCGEPRLPYDRVRLSELLASEGPSDSFELRPIDWYQDHSVRLVLGRAASRIETSRHRLELAGGPGVDAFPVVVRAGHVLVRVAHP
jgi:nitrite reductase (NADH) large subunit